MLQLLENTSAFSLQPGGPAELERSRHFSPVRWGNCIYTPHDVNIPVAHNKDIL
jgi:hypothetical protein